MNEQKRAAETSDVDTGTARHGWATVDGRRLRGFIIGHGEFVYPWRKGYGIATPDNFADFEEAE